ncbi:hypothetical protein F5B19DRAFT_493267 [Rostrohypoxylon terebratum]|nr:hypothetical protein F5B19DRAFT_493267 [Rostrohypoxylon terebratum]
MAWETLLAQEPYLNPYGLYRPITTVKRNDFSQTSLADHYSPYFAMIIDNLLTPEECAAVLASAGSDWETLRKGDSWRECARIYSVSPEWAKALSKRLRPYLPDEVTLLRKSDPLAESIAGLSNLKACRGAFKTVWKFTGANERLSFLRYQPGDHFMPHCDSLYSPSAKKKSFLTCQIYLSDMPEGDEPGKSSGGETRFWPSREGAGRKTSSDNTTEDSEPQTTNDSFLDVEPKMGRALVFQQRMLWHSGQEVKQGEKFTVRIDLMYEHLFRRY